GGGGTAGRGLGPAPPAVTEFQVDLLWCRDQIGILLLQTGKLAEALEAHGKALAITQKLADANPASTEVQLDLACSRSYIGRVLARLKRFPEAFTALDAGLALHRKLAERDPENTVDRSSRAGSHASRGGARARAGHPAAAAADLRRAVELWARVLPLDTAHIFAYHSRFELARALALLAGLGKDAKSRVTKGEGRRVAGQSAAAPPAAVKTRSAPPPGLREPDLPALP